MNAVRLHCVLCGSVQGHHPTRRAAPSAAYFDPALRLWLCSGPPHNHHSRVHEALREEAPVELWVVKNRSGPVPLEPITLLFDGALGSFRASDRSLR